MISDDSKCQLFKKEAEMKMANAKSQKVGSKKRRNHVIEIWFWFITWTIWILDCWTILMKTIKQTEINYMLYQNRNDLERENMDNYDNS